MSAEGGLVERVIHAAVTHRRIVMALTALCVTTGLVALATMPRREDPLVTIRAGLVVAEYPGASALQVESHVAHAVESRLFRYAEVKRRKTVTTARPGLFIANVELEDWVTDPDRFWATLRHDLAELRTDLPRGVRGPVVNTDFGDVSAVLLAVRSASHGARELAVILDEIEDGIRAIPDVAKVRRYGEQAEEIAVTARSDRLAQLGVAPPSIAAALAAHAAVSASGSIESAATDVSITTSKARDADALVRSIRQVIIPIPNGASAGRAATLRLAGIADVERRYADPSTTVRVNGETAVLMAVEMQAGENIVTLGRAIREQLDILRPTLPAGITVDAIADQPREVKHRIVEFGREFGIALVAVLLVTVLLLPLRVAAVAAVAIPVTVLTTVAVLNALGIELHQLTFAGLVIALGMVVDDAIVVADNYVELLDHGVPAIEAARRSASDLAGPILGATLTIVASFLPLAFAFPGTMGEFTFPMPVTVSVALLVSYAVAMLVTPALCLTFIATGLRPHLKDGGARNGAATRWSPLDAMQRSYGRVMHVAIPRPWRAIGVGVFAVVAGIALMRIVPQRFFPAAERDQFLVDVWLAEGAAYRMTDSALARLARRVKSETGVLTVTAFTGSSAPRFYYNVTPEAPANNYGQLLVTTASTGDTPRLVSALRMTLADVAPEARVLVRELQQGAPVIAPIEVRLTGSDADTLQALGARAQQVLEATSGAADVYTDWHESVYALGLEIRPQASTRAGLTEGDVREQLSAGLDGATVGAIWDGDRRVDVRLRFDSASRRDPDAVLNAYVTSPLTGVRVAVRQVADLVPEWGPSRIVRRNGIRTLTVRASAAPHMLAHTVLSAARATLDTLTIPSGYGMEFGGEVEAQAELQGPMGIATAASLLGIFLILFLQFGTLRAPLVIMVSIPLAIFGAALGLLITGNPFGFTANLGLNALTGVVVRNAIILVDYIVARRRDGETLEQAALDAGQRRLRPIFLTTMAAAVGVTPLILSGSSLWSPLASVLAVGLICSMVFTLVVVPALYVVVERGVERRALRKATRSAGIRGAAPIAATALLILCSTRATAQVMPERPPAAVSGKGASGAVRLLSLDEAVTLAMRHARQIAVARAQVEEAQAIARGASAGLFPALSTSGGMAFLPEGSGFLSQPTTAGAGASLQPPSGQAAVGVSIGVSQPLTPLLAARATRRAAHAGVDAAEASLRMSELDAATLAERLYVTALIAARTHHSFTTQAAAARARLIDASNAEAAGFTLTSATSERRSVLLESEDAALASSHEAAEAQEALAELIGLDADEQLQLTRPPPLAPLPPLSSVVSASVSAIDSLPEMLVVLARERQLAAIVTVTRVRAMPAASIFARYVYQDAVPMLEKSLFVAGVGVSWVPLDFGRQRAERDAAAARHRASLEVVQLTRSATLRRINDAYRSAQRADLRVKSAQSLLVSLTDAARVLVDRNRAGLVLTSISAEAEAGRVAAETSLMSAELGARLARTALWRALGASTDRIPP